MATTTRSVPAETGIVGATGALVYSSLIGSE